MWQHSLTMTTNAVSLGGTREWQGSSAPMKCRWRRQPGADVWGMVWHGQQCILQVVLSSPSCLIIHPLCRSGNAEGKKKIFKAELPYRDSCVCLLRGSKSVGMGWGPAVSKSDSTQVGARTTAVHGPCCDKHCYTR